MATSFVEFGIGTAISTVLHPTGYAKVLIQVRELKFYTFIDSLYVKHCHIYLCTFKVKRQLSFSGILGGWGRNKFNINAIVITQNGSLTSPRIDT